MSILICFFGGLLFGGSLPILGSTEGRVMMAFGALLMLIGFFL